MSNQDPTSGALGEEEPPNEEVMGDGTSSPSTDIMGDGTEGAETDVMSDDQTTGRD